MPTVNLQDSLDALDPATVVVAPIFDGDELDDVPEISELGGVRLEAALERGEARSSLYELTLFQPEDRSPGLMLVGAGDRDAVERLVLMRVAASASRFLTGRGYTRLAIVDRGIGEPFDFAHAAVEGAIRGAYNSGLKKSKQESRQLDQVVLISFRGEREELARGAEVGRSVGESAALARDLVNLPPNEITPSALADRAAALAAEHGMDCEVLDQNGLKERGMGALLGVAAGSRQPPRLIVLRYGNREAPIKLALVGKGLTFDSGGLSLKTAEGMETMKSDMGGAAAVIGGMVAVARLGLRNICVTGYVGATENMPGGEAMRPGDVLTALTGETIEVLNTDAEGRLVLADVLAYAVQEGASHIVDFATLTGGAVVALGHVATLSTGRPAEWVAEVVQAADRGLERAWHMPLFPEYRRIMDSEIADIKNSGGRAASPLTAAAFLGDFVGDVPWAHMDIAGTAWAQESEPFRPKGGTGEGVGTIVSLARRLHGSDSP